MKRLMTAVAAIAGANAFGVVTTNFLNSSGLITEPRTSYWKGVAYDMTKPTSWADDQLPGRFRDTMEIYEDDVLKETVVFTNGAYGSTIVFDGYKKDGGHRDGNYHRLDGSDKAWDAHPPILSYKNAIFTKGCLQHVFYDWRNYIFEAGGGIFVDETAPYAPSFGDGSKLLVVNCTTTDPEFFIRNDCLTSPVKLQSAFWIKENRTGGGTIRMKVRFQGQGDIKFAGGWAEYDYSRFSWLSVEQTNDAKVVFLSPPAGKAAYSNPMPITRIEFQAGTGRRHFELQEGTSQATFYDQVAIKAHTDVDLIGPGQLYLCTGDNAASETPAIQVDPNCTVRCSAKIRNRNGHEQSSDAKPLRGLFVQGGGTFEVLEGMKCTIPGTFRIAGGTTVKTATVGSSGTEETPFGQNAEIVLSGGSRLLYTGGESEFTDRTLALTGDGKIATTDFGALTFAGATGTGTLTVESCPSAPIEFAGAVTGGLVLEDGAKVKFSCPDGADSLALTPASFKIDGTASVIVDSGVTLTTSGEVNFGGTVPEIYGTWVHDGGIVGFDLSKIDFDEIQSIVSQLTLANGALVGYDATEGATVALTAADVPAEGIDFVKVGTGVITLQVDETIENPVRIRVAGGKLILKGTGELKHATVKVESFDGVTVPEIEVEDLTVHTDTQIVTGSDSAKTPAVISTYRQTGGDVTSFFKESAGSGDRSWNMKCGYGFTEIAGGAFEHVGGAYFGGSPSQAIIYHSAGDVKYTLGSSYFVFGNWDTQAILYHTGGMRHVNVIYSPWWNSNANKPADQVCSIMTTEGPLATNITASLYLGNWHTSTPSGEKRLSAYNVNDGGVLCIYSCALANGVAPISGLGRAFLNFDGGVLRLHTTNKSNLFGNGAYTLPQVLVFGGGMTMEMTTYAYPDSRSETKATAPINGATGKGVVAVEIPDAVANRTFAGPPAVCLIGDGDDASAVVLWDRATGRVTGVKITCPGVNYTTCKARWCYQGYDFRAESAVTLADNGTDGGLTVRGNGTFTLELENGYAGPTKVVKPATLALGASDVVNPASPLVLDGGTLALGEFAQTFSDITIADGGKVTGGKVTVTGLSVDFDAAKAGAPKAVNLDYCAFASGAKLTLANYSADKLAGADRYALVAFANGLAEFDCSGIALPEGWEFVTRGGALVLRKPRPSALLVR